MLLWFIVTKIGPRYSRTCAIMGRSPSLHGHGVLCHPCTYSGELGSRPGFHAVDFRAPSYCSTWVHRWPPFFATRCKPSPRLGAGPAWRAASEWTCAAPLVTCAGYSSLSLYHCSSQLTWRDVQHLLVKTSRPAHLKANDWTVNGAGHKGAGSGGLGRDHPLPSGPSR